MGITLIKLFLWIFRYIFGVLLFIISFKITYAIGKEFAKVINEWHDKWPGYKVNIKYKILLMLYCIVILYLWAFTVSILFNVEIIPIDLYPNY